MIKKAGKGWIEVFTCSVCALYISEVHWSTELGNDKQH